MATDSIGEKYGHFGGGQHQCHQPSAKPPPVPFTISFWYPTNGQSFVGLHHHWRPCTGDRFQWAVVETVQYFSGATSLGILTNTKGVWLTNTTAANPFFLAWSNVVAGIYALTAVATDSAGLMATSAVVNITVTNRPPGVSIYAPDPVAVEGTNVATNLFLPPGAAAYYATGSNTATFLVRRDTPTNADLTVNYSISGTASNGVDYAAIPNQVTIPAGQRYALITIVPLIDNDTNRASDTVLLALTPSTNAPPTYTVGSPAKAGAIILEAGLLPIMPPTVHRLSDNSIHVSIPADNGLNFSLQVSSDNVNWVPVCTNTVVKGSAQFVDPNGSGNTSLFYRIVPSDPPSY